VAAFRGPILAECGGLLYLCRELDGRPMCGVLPASARMTARLHLGYREAEAATATPWLDAGTRVRGHEFHYSEVEPGRRPGGLDAARARPRTPRGLRGGRGPGQLPARPLGRASGAGAALRPRRGGGPRRRMSLTLVTGGTRSGKSARAEALARRPGARSATSRPRIRRTRRWPSGSPPMRRAAGRWTTVEANGSLAGTLGAAGECVLVDGLGAWLARVHGLRRA
jgi:cobyrinic acid a,c-diamide synthase